MTGLPNRIPLFATFLADGVFSLVAAAVCIVFAAPLAAWCGPSISPSVFTIIGSGLLGSGLFHIAAGRSGTPSAIATRISMAGDILWIVTSIAILVFTPDMLTTAGIVLVAAAMIGVANFLFLKAKGFSRQQAAVL